MAGSRRLLSAFSMRRARHADELHIQQPGVCVWWFTFTRKAFFKFFLKNRLPIPLLTVAVIRGYFAL